jgi:hypothetical protein
LVAIHPLADALADEFPSFSWLLRAHAFNKFGYDPDEVFSSPGVNKYGFTSGFTPKILFSEDQSTGPKANHAIDRAGGPAMQTTPNPRAL